MQGIVNENPTRKVMVIDTGVLADHTDLKDNLVDGLSININLATQRLDPEAPLRDFDGHGTHVAGIMFARWNNGAGTAVGVVGKALGGVCGCQIDPEGGMNGTCTDVECVEHAIKNNVSVINMSFGVTVETRLPANHPARKALEKYCSAGGLVFIASGNDGTPTCDSGRFNYPACFAEDLAGESSVQRKIE
jgi:subtilisin family serine protease